MSIDEIGKQRNKYDFPISKYILNLLTFGTDELCVSFISYSFLILYTSSVIKSFH